jgi:hypothetical protein
MAGETFQQTLAKLQTSNLMSGAVIKGQAELLTARTEGTQKVISDFNTRLQELEREPLTTEDQLAEINKDPTVTEDMVDLEEQLANFSSFSINIIRQQEQLNKLYGGTISALGVIGGEDASRLTGLLENQQSRKVNELERQRQLPFETQAYKQSMFQVETMKLELMTGKITLDDLKRDREVTQLMADMLTTDEFTRMNLERNSATGKKRFNLDNFKNSMFLRYGGNPNFSRAWGGLDEYIRTNTQTYRPNFTTTTGTAANLMESLTQIKSKYMELVDMTNRMGDLEFGEGYQWARDEYQAVANAMFGDEVITNQDKFAFGSSPKVIAGMEGSAKQVAEEVHEVRHNKNSDQFYNKHYRMLGNLLTSQYGQYTPLSPYIKKGTDENPYPLMDGSGLDPTKIIVPIQTNQGTNIFDRITGRTNPLPSGGGYWNPHDPASFEDFETAIDKTRKEMLRQGDSRRDEFEVPSNINQNIFPGDKGF